MRHVATALGCLAGLVMLDVFPASIAAHSQAPASPIPPVVSVWYRGVPAGVPRQDDLAAIRALGFTAVTWPSIYAGALPDLRRLADATDLAVDVRPAPVPQGILTPAKALTPDEAVDISVAGSSSAMLPALAWRALAHGARRLAIDAGAAAGAGLDRPDAAWVRPAAALARQLAGNAAFFAELGDAPFLTIESRPNAHVDLVLRQTERAWILIATNTDRVEHQAVSRLPRNVPSAMWVSLIDGEAMSMLSLPDGARWTVSLVPGEARAYVIDKLRS